MKTRAILVGLLLLVSALSAVALAFEVNTSETAAVSSTYSGDDAYDPAAAGHPERSVAQVMAKHSRALSGGHSW